MHESAQYGKLEVFSEEQFPQNIRARTRCGESIQPRTCDKKLLSEPESTEDTSVSAYYRA